MINLLPPYYKEKLQQDRIVRLTIIIGSLTIFFFVAFGLVLASVNFYIQGMISEQEITITKEKERLQSPQLKSFGKEMIFFQEKAFELNAVHGKWPRFSDVIIKISQILPNSIYLTQISFSEIKDDDSKSKVAVYGFAQDRNSLFQFSKKLEEDSAFQELYFPPANWTKARDINFSISFNIKQ